MSRMMGPLNVARGRNEVVVACGEGALVLEEIETAAELAVGAMLG